MQATVTFTESTRGTVFPQSVTAHVLTAQPIAGNPRDGARIVMFVNDRDHDRLEKLLRSDVARINVVDLLTSTKHTLVRADCGLGCRCAVKIAKSEANA